MKRVLLALASAVALMGCAAQAQEAPPAAAPAQAAVAPAAGARVMMLRVYVSDAARAAEFYGEVFGAVGSNAMGGNGGGNVRIMTLPGGLPGLILIQSEQEETMNGSWVMQVPDLQGTLERAAAHGATLMNTNFDAEAGGMPSRSSHFVDPDGNIIEVLQMGGAR